MIFSGLVTGPEHGSDPAVLGRAEGFSASTPPPSPLAENLAIVRSRRRTDEIAMLTYRGARLDSILRHGADSKTMWDQIRDLHVHHGNVPVEVRLLKLTEEVGEAAEAFIGMHGLNSRKGVCRSRDDLLAELADVVITAAVAMSGVTGGDVDEARSHLEQRLAVVTERARRSPAH
jgi:hypothetical protein